MRSRAIAAAVQWPASIDAQGILMFGLTRRCGRACAGYRVETALVLLGNAPLRPKRVFTYLRRGLNCRYLSVGHVNRTLRALCQFVVVRDQDNRRSLIVDGLK